MSSVKDGQRGPGSSGEAIAVWTGIAVVAAACLFTWVPLQLAAQIDGTPSPTGNPFALLTAVATGTVAWPRTATLVAVVLATVLTVVMLLAGLLVLRRRAGRKRVDRAARWMGRGRQIAGTSHREATRTALRLGVVGEPGLEVARTVTGGRPVLQDWESVSVDIWGPRAGKSSARAIPAIMAAPGAVLATSNKRDLVDATRDPRSQVGQVWVFDPQALIAEPTTWWWNPLTYVTDETRAHGLAEIFASAVRKPGARTDAYFDTAALDLLAALLLAAASGHRDLTQVYLWLTDPNDDEPARLLETAGYRLSAAAVRGVIGSPDKQRAGVYGTAQQVCSFMTNTRAMTWVTPPQVAGVTGVAEFHPELFVRTSDTLYSLSREGRGNAAPIVTALTVAVCEAAEEYAATQPHGRLSIPIVGVLDEAANVCRWPALPDLYSHYGSRGINLLTFLQSWSQGVEAWGRDGMRKLWSAANVKVYGGGVSEVEFLEEISRLIGDYRHADGSVTHSRQGRSTSRQQRTDRILDVADLAALDRGRVIVFSAGSVPVLAQTIPWWRTPHRAAVTASLASYDPGQPTPVDDSYDPARVRPSSARQEGSPWLG